MLTHQIKLEIKKTISWNQLLFWLFLISALPSIKFYLIKDDYVYFRQIEVFLRINSDFVPILFPLLVVIIYAYRFIGEQKNNFLIYVNSRISIEKYLKAKLITNAILSFIVSFLIVFVPFIFIMYIEPLFNIITIYPEDGSEIPYTTFEQFLPLGTLTYGLLYCTWVGINGLLYSSFGFLLLIIKEKPLVALSTPFIYYLVANFIAQLLGLDKFSPGSTVFPFSVAQQPLWTVLIPFTLLILIVLVLTYILRSKVKKSYE